MMRSSVFASCGQGCRRHELVYAKPRDLKKAIKEEVRWRVRPMPSRDVNIGSDPYIQPRPKVCWVCDELDEREEAAYKVLPLLGRYRPLDPARPDGRWRPRPPRDARYFCASTRAMTSRWCLPGSPSSKRSSLFSAPCSLPPVLCPLFSARSLISSPRLLAEGVIDKPDFFATRTELFFNTKISMPAVRIPWKREFWHKPVFRKTVESVEGPEKSDEPADSGHVR
ncbi:hypothetical protein B0T17DRAFT_400710 [Bombardia bombarda]|uniref:Uncharacterized protein n=1 Tax=Bombardia bombarda TaxID=252184 RepID=A0AA39T2P8_9PEZI|nr:hypothetical protein B0T17DRAFT_400710 [Bombardia bombarda]